MAQGPADNPAWWEQTRADLRVICAKVAALGFNAISLAEIAHLADFERLEPYLRTRVAMFQREMVKCLAIGDGHGLKVFVTMAVMILIPELKQRIKTGGVDFLTALLDSFLADFPQATGVIARIGEEGGRCFNGAALVGVRRAGFDSLPLSPWQLLQRSRTRWSAESTTFPPTPTARPSSFNGAALVGVRRGTEAGR